MPENIYRAAIEKPSDRVIVALDDMTWNTAQGTIGQTARYIGMAKANSLAQKPGWEATIGMITELGDGSILAIVRSRNHRKECL